MARLRDWWQSSDSSVQIHRTLTFVWLAMVPVAIFTDLKTSIVFLVFVSIYANVVGHWSAWQSGIVEKKQDESP
jgi:hypothetical protein